MNPRFQQQTDMSNDNQVIKLTADVQNLRADVNHLQSDVTEIKAEVRSLWAVVEELKTQFVSFKVEVAKELGAFRTEMARELGSIRTSIERAKLWMIVTGLGTILSVWGAAFALARFLKP
jgi:archaellum component FlaC